YLAVEPVLIQVSEAAGVAQMLIYSNIDWTTGTDVNWISMPAGASGTAAIQITYGQNESFIARSGVITISGNNLSASATLEQAGVETTVSVSPGNANVDYLAGNVNFNVISNTEWTASADSAWLTVTPSGNLSGTLVATYLQNPYYADRMSTISISVAGKEPEEVSLTQSSSEVSIEETDLQGISIFPNPSRGIFVLEADPARYPSLDVQLTDLTGHAILSRICKGDSRYTFDLTNLTEGAYTMNIKTENNLITRKIVIIR
ncbi:MAG: T9SS type A sorting domain-containing protein, partial [Lentimicrobium sp.]|nr:T9SS type A sorting domain-containing protein [Lentimicrobium sp.]